MHRPAPDPTAPSRPPWRVIVITLFPDLFPGPLDASLIGTARASAIWLLDTIDLRTHGLGRHRAVDDTPAGGGAGMVLRPDVMAAAINQARTMHPSLPLIYLSPRGMPFTQTRARALAAGPGAILIAGRFEGLDQRVIDACTIEEISVGDYVLSGGELPAMILIDACVRLLPGVLGGAESLTEESFESGLLEYPQYTKPRDWQGHPTPDVLLSGDHAKISAWRREQAENLTRMRRPDLFIPARKPPKR